MTSQISPPKRFKHLEVSEELHRKIDLHCTMNLIKIKDWVEAALSNHPDIKPIRIKGADKLREEYRNLFRVRRA